MDRSAPDDGYDFGNKRQYRRDVWATFRRNCHALKRDANVLLMPSAEGDEIDVALSNGFRENRLFAVDRNAAIVATLKRRYRKINTYGVDITLAAERIERAGIRLHCANLDLCGSVRASTYRTLAAFARSGALCGDALIAVTCLRGREPGAIPSVRPMRRTVSEAAVTGMSETDLRRLEHIGWGLAAVGDNGPAIGLMKLIRAGSYRSTAGTQTMLWSVWRRMTMDGIRDVLEGCIRRAEETERRTTREYEEAIGTFGQLYEEARQWADSYYPMLDQHVYVDEEVLSIESDLIRFRHDMSELERIDLELDELKQSGASDEQKAVMLAGLQRRSSQVIQRRHDARTNTGESAEAR